MKVIVINGRDEGYIKTCADIRSAFQYLIEGGWLTVFKPVNEALDDFVAEYEKNNKFLDGDFYFHEIKIYKGNK